MPELEQRFPGRVHRADLSREGAAKALVEAVLAVDGALHHLVHAVGDYAEGSLSEMSGESFRQLFESNVFTARDMSEAARGPLRDLGLRRGQERARCLYAITREGGGPLRGAGQHDLSWAGPSRRSPPLNLGPSAPR